MLLTAAQQIKNFEHQFPDSPNPPLSSFAEDAIARSTSAIGKVVSIYIR